MIQMNKDTDNDQNQKEPCTNKTLQSTMSVKNRLSVLLW